MRAVLVVLVLAACGRQATGPAWPRSAGTVVVDDWSQDGGEGLEPRVLAAASVEASAGPEPEPVAAPVEAQPEVSGPADTASAPAEPPADGAPPLDDGSMDEIIIEIED